MLKLKPLRGLPACTETRVSQVLRPWQGRDSNAQSLQEQSLCESKGLQMLGKQINKFGLQECLPLLFSVCPAVQTILWIFLKILMERPLRVALFSNKKALVFLA